jgi:uncharacterized membrane protein
VLRRGKRPLAQRSVSAAATGAVAAALSLPLAGSAGATPAAQSEISAFLEPAGRVIDVCGGSPCHSYDYTP